MSRLPSGRRSDARHAGGRRYWLTGWLLWSHERQHGRPGEKQPAQVCETRIERSGQLVGEIGLRGWRYREPARDRGTSSADEPSILSRVRRRVAARCFDLVTTDGR